tara:strand:+ start:747 stop:938 length:192 start_codon:yes stop_codon:yes gene_type:complete
LFFIFLVFPSIVAFFTDSIFTLQRKKKRKRYRKEKKKKNQKKKNKNQKQKVSIYLKTADNCLN